MRVIQIILNSLFIGLQLILSICLSAQVLKHYDKDGFPIPGSIKGPKFGKDSVECVKQLSLYRENYKQWRSNNFRGNEINYTIGPWRYVFLHCPISSQNTYIDGLRVVEYLIDNASNEELKQRYIDTLLMIYDQRIMAFGKAQQSAPHFVLGRKAADMLKYRPNEIQLIYQTLDKSISLGKNESEPFILYYYMLATIRMLKEIGLDSVYVYNNYETLTDIITNNFRVLRNKENLDEREQKLLKDFEEVQRSIESLFEPFATCDKLTHIYQQKFTMNPNDTVMLLRLLISFDRKNCINDLYIQAAEKFYKLKPSPTSALANGRLLVKLERYQQAIPYLQDAINGLTDNNDKADAHFLLAEAYRQMRNFSQARTNALRAAELRPNDGRPWILIGDMYSASASICAGGDKISSRAVYWAAVDKYIRARTVDESVAEIANSRIQTCSRMFPSTEDLFFHGLKKGDTYRVECWINESTIIRSSD